jgi:methylenetetrahydrofolate--tRNA-(uracil-5-)-methyltransferase
MDCIDLTVIGGGLAGCEAAWQAAEKGLTVRLYEMRPIKNTGAHTSPDLAELVCSNSLGSMLSDRASGILKNELKTLNSILIECAEATSLPAGTALAVDRTGFAKLVTEKIQRHPRIEVIREEVIDLPDGLTVVASGPLTSEGLVKSIARISGEDYLFFFDAIAPIVSAESINLEIAFRGARYDRNMQSDGDYINCPMDRTTYEKFEQELAEAERIEIKEFEKVIQTGVKAGIKTYFEGCLPVEVLARRGNRALAFGPMRPVGIRHPRTGERAYAVLQLRQDNLAGNLYNMVGFQTNLTFQEQKRVFRMIPGLENADFVRYGQMHRNTFIASPKLINPFLQFRARSNLFFSGQIVGVEGYMGNIAMGLLAGLNAARQAKGEALLEFPRTTMIGALTYYITHAEMADFQPMKANLGILPEITGGRNTRKERASAHSQRSKCDLESFISESDHSNAVETQK